MRTLLAGLAFILTIASAQAAHTQAQLILADEAARPGDTVLAGVHLKMEPGWHTYWKNPGEAGMATKIVWQLPAGVTAGDIQWPLPEKLPPAEVTTYGYQNEVVLLVPLKLVPDVKPGALKLSAKVSWLECKEQCLPGDAMVEATLNVGPQTISSPDAVALLKSWQAKTPRTDKLFLFQVRWEKKVADDQRTIIIEGTQVGTDTMPIERAEFFPDASDNYEIQGATEKVPSKTGFALRKTVKQFSEWPSKISGVVVIEGNGQRNGFELNEAIATASAPSAAAGFSMASLLVALGSAFLGGLILNIMPCVLPVIALKVFSFVKQSGEEPRRARRLGLVYAAGVVASFVILAGFLIAAQKAGHVASWGSQMQNRNFVLGMTILVALVALNLFGLFEVTLGGSAMNAASSLTNKSGASGAFFNGVLATALAIPCTAPFLTAALAFALAQPPGIIVLTFCFIGFGLAAPYVVLTWNPKLLKWVPKPGPWMQQFKIALGFPMLATVVWLYKLSLNHLSKSQSLWFGIFLVALAFSAWVWGEFVQRGTRRRIAAGIVSLSVIAGVGAYAVSIHEDIKWAPWSQAEVEKARSEGRPVLVDFTADWCLTCKLNLRTSIEVDKVRSRLAELHVATLLADYSVTNETIGRELQRFGRDAVPLVVVFPKDPKADPIVLPPVLTPGTVLDALDQATK